MKKYFAVFYIVASLLILQAGFAYAQSSVPSSTFNNGVGVFQPPPTSEIQIIPGGSRVTCSNVTSASNVGDIFQYGTCLIGQWIIPLMFLLATVVFMWGVIQFIGNSQEEAKRAQGRQFMIWGIIALAVAFSIWGLVGILTKTFSLQSGSPPIQPIGQ